MKLTRMQVAAVRQMSKSLAPIERNIDKLQAKREAIEAEIADAEAQIAGIHRAIENFTGGMTLQQVLNPEAVPAETMEEGAAIDGEATADETDVTNVFNDAVVSPAFPPIEEEYPELNIAEEAVTEGPSI